MHVHVQKTTNGKLKQQRKSLLIEKSTCQRKKNLWIHCLKRLKYVVEVFKVWLHEMGCLGLCCNLCLCNR